VARACIRTRHTWDSRDTWDTSFKEVALALKLLLAAFKDASTPLLGPLPHSHHLTLILGQF
jgi:hypothetical protein